MGKYVGQIIICLHTALKIYRGWESDYVNIAVFWWRGRGWISCKSNGFVSANACSSVHLGMICFCVHGRKAVLQLEWCYVWILHLYLLNIQANFFNLENSQVFNNSNKRLSSWCLLESVLPKPVKMTVGFLMFCSLLQGVSMPHTGCVWHLCYRLQVGS